MKEEEGTDFKKDQKLLFLKTEQIIRYFFVMGTLSTTTQYKFFVPFHSVYFLFMFSYVYSSADWYRLSSCLGQRDCNRGGH